MQIEVTRHHGELANDVRPLIVGKAEELRHLPEPVAAIQATVDMVQLRGVEGGSDDRPLPKPDPADDHVGK
ncbi:MAG: hypothetical protein CMJ65_11755 [Planctomycetaceae bacterium]|nr:hypothetical protein [Planctomycetaceae bacterium]